MKNARRMLVPMVALVVVAIVAYPLYAQAVGKGIAAAKDLIKAMETDKATLVKAVEAAEKHESGGKAVQAEAVMNGKDLTFQVYTVKGDKIMLVTVEGKTGKATKADEVKEIGGKPEKAATEKKEEPKKTEKATKGNGKKTEPTKKP
jgi:anionic cell wall polymer biosynthesis LytR-Cps2A-Psr (LCP) family protein